MAVVAFVGRLFPSTAAFLAEVVAAFPAEVDAFVARWRETSPSDDDEGFIRKQFDLQHAMPLLDPRLELLNTYNTGTPETVYLGITDDIVLSASKLEAGAAHPYQAAVERLLAALPSGCPLLPPDRVERWIFPYQTTKPRCGCLVSAFDDDPNPLLHVWQA